MVTYFDVCEILEMLSEASVKVFLDGGWGVDALIGRETRIHNDIDLFVEKKDYGKAISVITWKGYREVVMSIFFPRENSLSSVTPPKTTAQESAAVSNSPAPVTASNRFRFFHSGVIIIPSPHRTGIKIARIKRIELFILHCPPAAIGQSPFFPLSYRSIMRFSDPLRFISHIMRNDASHP